MEKEVSLDRRLVAEFLGSLLLVFTRHIPNHFGIQRTRFGCGDSGADGCHCRWLCPVCFD